MKKPPAKRSNPPNNGGNHTTISVQSHKWEAPLPPPAALQAFEDIVPGSAERIIKAWEVESAHRREMDKNDQNLFYTDLRIGKRNALIFVIAALGVSAFAVYLGAEWMGAILGAGTIGAVVWAFVKSQQRNK